jgi:uncharacterized protein YggU (UPF0235/DUF167 family)
MYRKVKLTPNAKQNSIKKEIDLLTGENVWYVRVQAKPVDGEANKALISFLADEWQYPRRLLSISS